MHFYTVIQINFISRFIAKMKLESDKTLSKTLHFIEDYIDQVILYGLHQKIILKLIDYFNNLTGA